MSSISDGDLWGLLVDIEGVIGSITETRFRVVVNFDRR